MTLSATTHHAPPAAPDPETSSLSGSGAERGARTRSTALVWLAVVAVFGGLYAMRAVFVPLTFALMLFFLLRGPVCRLARLHVPRLIGSALVLGAAIAALSFATLELAAPATTWAQRLPSAVQELETKSRTLRSPLEQVSRGLVLVRRLADVEGAEKVPRVAVVRPGWLQGLVQGAAELTSQLALTVVAAFFLLIDGDRLLDRLFHLKPAAPARRRASSVMGEVGQRMSQYLRAVTLINFGLGACVALAFALLGMPNPVLWGVMAMVLTYVPYLGPAIGIALVALASFVTFPSTAAALAPPLVYFVLASIEGNLVTPLVLGHSFRISPLLLFVWLSLWVWLWSVPGAILAVPMLMLVKIVCDENPELAGLGYLLGK
jgi:predicted PurR-regulated permease PerM